MKLFHRHRNRVRVQHSQAIASDGFILATRQWTNNFVFLYFPLIMVLYFFFYKNTQSKLRYMPLIEKQAIYLKIKMLLFR